MKTTIINANIMPISLARVPECVLGEDQKTPLKQWLSWLHQKAGERKPISDDSFSKEDFNYSKRFTWGASLRRFGNFAQFKKFLNQYIASKLCSDACKEKSASADLFTPIKICPEGPQIPLESSIPRLNLARAPWAQVSPPNSLPSPQKSVIVASLAPDFSRQFPSPFEKYVDEAPDKTDADQPKMNASFDGKDFILDFHGCEVRPERPTVCESDWPLYWLHLDNVSSGQTEQKQADAEGWVRIKVAAEKGNHLVVWGIDSSTHQLSLSKLIYEITEEGKIRFVGSFPFYHPTSFQKAIDTLLPFTAPIPQLTGLLLFLKNPAAWQQ